MTAEVLPVRVLDPAIHQRFVRQIERVLEIVKPDQQPNRFRRSSRVRAVTLRERHVEPGPVNLPRQNTQRMIQIQQLLKPSLKQIQLTGFRS